MDYQRYLLFLLVLLFSLALSSCSSTKAPTVLDANEIATLGEKCEALYKSHIDAWNSRNPENLRLIYSEEIVHFDGRPLFVGIDSVVDMANQMFEVFPDWQMEAGTTFISKDVCVGTWINWGIFGFLEDDPGLEFDTLETQNGLISFWRAYYSQNFHEAIDSKDLVDDDFLLKFASSWSSGNADEVVSIYSKDAEIEDSLYRISVVGIQPIKEYADGFFAKNPNMIWELVNPFAESEVYEAYKEEYPFASQGGVFSITTSDSQNTPCDIRAVVILTPNEQGTIQNQKIYYEADTLLTCGWAE